MQVLTDAINSYIPFTHPYDTSILTLGASMVTFPATFRITVTALIMVMVFFLIVGLSHDKRRGLSSTAERQVGIPPN